MKKRIIFLSMLILFSQAVFSLENISIVQCAENWQCGNWSGCIYPRRAETNCINEINTPALIAYWRLEGDAKDSSPSTLNGTIYGAPAKLAGKAGDALNFNGETDWIEVPSNPLLEFTAGDSFSLACWVKVSGDPPYGAYQNCIRAQSDSGTIRGAYGLRLKADETAEFLVRDISGSDTDGSLATVTGGASLFDNNWHFIVGVRDAANPGAKKLKLYVDGTLKNEAADTTSPSEAVETGRPLYIGAYDWGGTRQEKFMGAIDEVSMYKKALSVDEINTMYNAGNGAAYCKGAISISRFGTRTRECVDTRNCGTAMNKPATGWPCPDTTAHRSCGGEPITECEPWGGCSNSQQTRVCVSHDTALCEFIQKTESQSCSAECTEDWQCTAWSACSGETQTKTCTDANACGTTASKPETTQPCGKECTPSWTCGSWSACANNRQARKCADENKCNDDKFKPIESQNCVPDIIPPSSATPPVVVAKAMSGIVSGNEGEIVFQMSNVDAAHKIEGFLSCSVPSDVMVTSSSNAASGSGAQYLSQTFKLGAAPSEKSMVMKLSSSSEGPKYFSCALNYVLYKDDKGYLMSNGQYSQEKKYFTVQAGKDVEFKAKKVTTGVRQEDISASAGKSKLWIWGVIIAVVLAVVYLLGKTSRRSP